MLLTNLLTIKRWKQLPRRIVLTAIALTTTLVMAQEVHIVAITQIVDHPALTQAHNGVIAGLKEQGFVDGQNLKIVFDNAHGNITTAAQIAQKFVSLSPDVIVPISTPSAQAVISADARAKIPVVFSTVTDPIAAQLVPSLKQPGGHVTGAIDLPPVAEQLKIIHEILPQAKTLGVLYNAAEINSVHMIKELKAANAGKMTIIEAHASSSNEVSMATLSLIGKVDAIYLPMDNTVISAINAVLQLAAKHKLPVFASDLDIVTQGALAALAYNQYDVGFIAGKMTAEILLGKDPGTIDVASPPKASLYINTSTAQQLNIKIPEAVLNNAAKLVTTEKTK